MADALLASIQSRDTHEAIAEKAKQLQGLLFFQGAVSGTQPQGIQETVAEGNCRGA